MNSKELKRFLAILYFLGLFIIICFLFYQRRIINKLENTIYNYESFENGIQTVNFKEL